MCEIVNHGTNGADLWGSGHEQPHGDDDVVGNSIRKGPELGLFS